jgi:hypothetical protein
VNCLHPGFVASEFLSKGGIWKLIKPLGYLFAVTEAAGAETSVYLASSPDRRGGHREVFREVPRGEAAPAPRRTKPPPKRLWEESARLTSLDSTI